jgi:hypothetical protein
MTLANLSSLKTGKARAIRLSTLDAICEVRNVVDGQQITFVYFHWSEMRRELLQQLLVIEPAFVER